MKSVLTIVLFLLSYSETIAQEKLQTGQYLFSETGTAIVRLKGTDEVFSVNPEPVLTIQDFEEAIVGYAQAPKGRSRVLLIKLSPEGQRKFREFTLQNIGKMSGTVISGELYTAIEIMTMVDIQYLEIRMPGTKRSTKQLVNDLNAEIARNNK
ncbi:SecDF P1 head subdomain-containing protein [Pontibacter burrus]|uniref:SecDF P1 head subdomain domain-containing protein n=1 Tax=Pontibacter burrus TaxID=2704466 RepID=A0A6B3LNB0_9BACT|nr:hypothetical protein [Pontibacter burrus]NEM98392.1 hypothetical protein [Pontibacter burrus]